MLRHALVGLLAICTACVSPETENLPYCGEPQNPILGGETCDAEGVAALQESLQPILDQDLGSGLVRVSFSVDSALPSICVAQNDGAGPWRTRRTLSKILADSGPLAPGPACAAGHRIELNRYRAKLSEIERAERQCSTQANTTVATNQNSGMNLAQVAAREFEKCMAYKADWVLLERRRGPPLLFSKPQLGPHPQVSPRETVNRCMRHTGPDSTIETQIACIQEDGWEMIR